MFLEYSRGFPGRSIVFQECSSAFHGVSGGSLGVLGVLQMVFGTFHGIQ